MGKRLLPRQELRGPTSLTLPGEGNPHCFLQIKHPNKVKAPKNGQPYAAA
jgi:hypothetical protein